MPNYMNGKVYKIVNDIDNYVYIGSTTLALNIRMIYHRKRAKKGSNANLYKHMCEIGIYHFKIILLRNVSCNNREELVREERIEFDKIDKEIRLNQLRPITTHEEKNELARQSYYKNNEKNLKYKRENSKLEHVKQHKKEYNKKIYYT